MAKHFLECFNRENARAIAFSPAAMRVLSSCYWPGNVRELENCVERAGSNIPTAASAHASSAAAPPLPPEAAALPAAGAAADKSTETAELAAEDGKPEGERERLIWAMERCGWVQAKAARLLKISPRQMSYALQKHEIEVHKF